MRKMPSLVRMPGPAATAASEGGVGVLLGGGLAGEGRIDGGNRLAELLEHEVVAFLDALVFGRVGLEVEGEGTEGVDELGHQIDSPDAGELFHVGEQAGLVLTEVAPFEGGVGDLDREVGGVHAVAGEVVQAAGPLVVGSAHGTAAVLTVLAGDVGPVEDEDTLGVVRVLLVAHDGLVQGPVGHQVLCVGGFRVLVDLLEIAAGGEEGDDARGQSKYFVQFHGSAEIRIRRKH